MYLISDNSLSDKKAEDEKEKKKNNYINNEIKIDEINNENEEEKEDGI